MSMKPAAAAIMTLFFPAIRGQRKAHQHFPLITAAAAAAVTLLSNDADTLRLRHRLDV